MDVGTLLNLVSMVRLYPTLIKWMLGKTFQNAKAVDLSGAIGTIRYYAGWADKVHGKTIEVGVLAYS